MAIRDIATMGFGSFSRVQLIPVLGYGLGNQFVPPAVPGIEFTAPSNDLHFEATESRLHFTAPANPIHFWTEEN